MTGIHVFKVINCILLLALITTVIYHVGTMSSVPRRQKNGSFPQRKRRSVENDNVRTTEGHVSPGGGAIYTRWGRTVCANNTDTELVYAGTVGGSWFQHSGGGSNYLCLPLDPIWGTHHDGEVAAGLIYGGEYQFSDSFPLNSGAIANLLNHNIPCAVCRATTRSSTSMLPARSRCYDDWTIEYSGYLATENHSHAGRTEYVCLDGRPEADEAGFRNENGALMYPVEGRCGSLPCPPYVNGRELTCAVCTR